MSGTLSLLDSFLVLFVTVAAALDLAARRIPNRLVLAGLACAFALRLGLGVHWPLLGTGLGGAATGFLLLLPFYCLRGMAAGDVKLMAMVGAFTGPALAAQICLATFLIGGVLALAIVLAKGRLKEALANLGLLLRGVLPGMVAVPLAPAASVGGMPYGVAIALGTWLMLLVEHA